MMRFFTLLIILSFSSLAHSQEQCALLSKQEQRQQHKLRASPELWSRLAQRIQKRTSGNKHPFEGKELDANEIGRVHQRFTQVFPSYGNLLQLTQKNNLDAKKF